ncbi:lipoyl synthase, partial [Pseudomonas syringae pv. tagetis]
LTRGQYLQPARNPQPAHRFAHPDTGAWLAEQGYKIGLKNVASGPLVRLANHAAEQPKIAHAML